MADVDGDGADDLVLAVSYFVEEESAARCALQCVENSIGDAVPTRPH